MNRDTTGLYQTLGVSKSSTQEEIKRAYRRLALVYHPDRARATGIADYETKFREIAAAYEILGDPQKRTVYDTYGTMGVKVAGSDFGLRFDFSHLIQHLLEFLTFLVLLVIIFFCFLSTRIDKLILWDFRIVFIPLWILDVFGVIVALLLIPVAASGVLYDDKYDDGERLGQQRRRNFRIFGILYSILDVIKVFALIAFQVLIVKKANNPSNISTVIVFVPYLAWEGLTFLSNFIAMFDSTKGVSFCWRLAAALRDFTWILTRMVFAALLILRMEEHIDYSWHVVFIPLYLACLLKIIDPFISAKGTTSSSSGSTLVVSVFLSFLIVIALWLPFITMLAAKLDGEPYRAAHVLIPVFVFLSTVFCCTASYLPKLLSYSNPRDVMGAMYAAEAARHDTDRQALERLLSAERQYQNNSYASTGSSTRIFG